MSLRIHKALGYGITNIKVKKLENDKRFKITEDHFYGNDSDAFSDKCQDLKGFRKWVLGAGKAFCEDVVRREHALKDDTMLSVWFNALKRDIDVAIKNKIEPHIQYDNDTGPKNVMLFVPPFEQHYRYDDMIDYYESKTPKNNVLNLTSCCGIYPNIGMIRYNTPSDPALLSLAPTGKMEPSAYNMAAGRWSKGSPPTVSKTELAHLLNDWRPVMPEIIAAFIGYMDVFHDPVAAINEMRPMILTWWG